MRKRSPACKFSLYLLIFSLFPHSLISRQFLILPSAEHFKEGLALSDNPSDPESDAERDNFGDSDIDKSDEELDPGSWRPIFEPDLDSTAAEPGSESEALYYSGIGKMMSAVSSGEMTMMQDATGEIETAAESGYPAAQSVLGFLYGMGIMKERSKAKAFLYHHFAAEGGNMQSKMALAYSYLRQDMSENAVKLYAELAEAAVSSFLISKDSLVIDQVRLHKGAEENTEALRKSRGEDDDDFQILEYQAQRGNAAAMYKLGLFYYFGLRGLRRDYAKALSWFLKSVDKGEPRSMEFLGEIYARGAGVERNYTKAMEWFTLASKQQLYSAYNGMGYLYAKGYGVEKNFSKAKEYFKKASVNDEVGGHYNLGVMFLKGIGVKRNLNAAYNYLTLAANSGQPKAFYQLARMFHSGIGLKRDIILATMLYKLVAERGPWNSMSRWALESYLKGDVGKAFMLYSRMAEMGYEVAQSNAAWILDKYGDHSMCVGESGFCTDTERHQRAHYLWWQASEQGNEHAALLIGDAYYYGRGIVRDYERAAEAYMHAKSQGNPQAMFNLGYMHERGEGLPLDLHLAKRYYDEALETDSTAKLPVTFALTSLWMRMNYADSFLVQIIDLLPELFPKLQSWIENVLLEEGNATIFTLLACLLAVLYFRERQRRLFDGAVGGVDQQRPDGRHVAARN